MRRRKHRKPKYSHEVNPDAAVLSLMRKHESDLSKPRPVQFYLYFPTEENAFVAKCELIAAGFSADLYKSTDASDWLCLASKEMAANEKELTSLRRYFTNLAKKLNGKYDGWETEMLL